MSKSDNAVIDDVLIACDAWRTIDPESLAAGCFAAIRKVERGVLLPVSVLFADDATLQRLNRDYRGKDRPTNVLSFPAGEFDVAAQAYLGDIALAFETCREEAAVSGVSINDHATHLLVHGMLHLIGYDHETEGAAHAMEQREAQILKTLGIANPYEALAAAENE